MKPQNIFNRPFYTPEEIVENYIGWQKHFERLKGRNGL